MGRGRTVRITRSYTRRARPNLGGRVLMHLLSKVRMAVGGWSIMATKMVFVLLDDRHCLSRCDGPTMAGSRQWEAIYQDPQENHQEVLRALPDLGYRMTSRLTSSVFSGVFSIRKKARCFA